jgi:hypothetical protein
MPLEVTDALLEFLFGEEQTIVLTIDRRAVASSADRRAQIAKQHLALAYQRFGELLAATDDLIAFLGSADRRAQAAAQPRALAAQRFDELALRFARGELALPALWQRKALEKHLKFCSHLLLKKDQMLQ